MEKISGILPASPRIKAVSSESLTPVRPGAPSFGRPPGSSDIGDKVTRSSVASAAGLGRLHETYNMPKEMVHRGIADRVADKFFETKIAADTGKLAEPEVADIFADFDQLALELKSQGAAQGL